MRYLKCTTEVCLRFMMGPSSSQCEEGSSVRFSDRPQLPYSGFAQMNTKRLFLALRLEKVFPRILARKSALRAEQRPPLKSAANEGGIFRASEI